MTPVKVLVTGGSGFIGSHIIKQLLAAGHLVCNVDNLTYAAVKDTRMEGVRGMDEYTFEHADISFMPNLEFIFEKFLPDMVIHAAAETHVDRSIDDGLAFLRTNTLGTYNMLEVTKKYVDPSKRNGMPIFCYVSTDEVYGPVPEDGWVDGVQVQPDGFCEHHRLNPRNPYAATKAASEHLTMAYHHTHGLPTVVTRGANTFGNQQVPEKFLPLMIRKAMNNEVLPVYGDGAQTREWLHARDHAAGIVLAADRGQPGSVYNFGPGTSECNLHVAEAILERLHKPASLIEHVADRPGHDRNYAICALRAEVELGWEAKTEFIKDATSRKQSPDGLDQIIRWYASDAGIAWCDKAGSSHLDRKGLGCTTETNEK